MNKRSAHKTVFTNLKEITATVLSSVGLDVTNNARILYVTSRT